MTRRIRPARVVGGTLVVPGDKSIAHRAALASVLAEAPIEVTGFPDNADCAASLEAARRLGVRVERSGGTLRLSPPDEPRREGAEPIDCRNSGTTARLLAGIVAGSSVEATLTGDASLRGRPMGRVAEPLRRMGARIEPSGAGGDVDRLPLRVRGGRLQALDYRLPVASAQVKSALLLAGLASGCPVTVREPTRTRDHTERLLRALGEGLTIAEGPGGEHVVHLASGSRLGGGRVDVPGDASTAAFFLAAAALSGATLTVTQLGLNPTRTAFLDHLVDLGCRVEVEARREVSGEPRGDVTVIGGPLHAASIAGERTVALIDEIPIAAVLAAGARGETRIRDAGELRHKESDRLEAISRNLTLLGVPHVVHEDGLDIRGGAALRGADLVTHGDHRIAMAFSVAALFADGPSTLDDDGCVAVSCPGFHDLLDGITD